MLYTKAKKEALSIYEHAVEKYNNTYQTMQETGSRLYSLRQDSVKLIQEIELLLKSLSEISIGEKKLYTSKDIYA